MFNFGDEPPLSVDTKKSGFFYQTDAGARFLRSVKSGFKEPDKEKLVANCGNIDWTDGKETITWEGSHRYSPPQAGTFLYRNGMKKDFSSLGGGICGAAFKKGVFLIFTFASNELSFSFVRGQTILASGTVGVYEQLTQIVAVSPDGMKGCFLAIPVGGFYKKTAVVELAINFSAQTVSISSEEIQNIEDATDYAANQDSYSRTEKTVVVAADYTESSVRVDFSIGTEFSFERIGEETGFVPYSMPPSGILGAVWRNHETVAVTETAKIDYNGIILESLSETSIERVTYGIFYGSLIILDNGYIDNMISNDPEHSTFWDSLRPTGNVFQDDQVFRYMKIAILDLRYSMMAYTEVTETVKLTGDFTVGKNFPLKISAFETVFDDEITVTGNTESAGVRPNFNLVFKIPMSPTSPTEIFGVPLYWNLSFHQLETSLVDRYQNKMLKLPGENVVMKLNKSNIFSTAPINFLTGVM